MDGPREEESLVYSSRSGVVSSATHARTGRKPRQNGLRNARRRTNPQKRDERFEIRKKGEKRKEKKKGRRSNDLKQPD